MGPLGLVAVAAVVGLQLVHADTIYPGVRVGNVSVGEMARERALAELEPHLVEQVSRPLRVRGAGTEQELRLADLGATFDTTATVDAAYAVGRTGGWTDRIAAHLGALTRGYSVEAPALRVDRSKLEAYLKQRAMEIDRQVRDSELVIGQDLSVRVTPSVAGRRLDVAVAAMAVERAVEEGAASLDLPVTDTQPKRVERDLEEARGLLGKMYSGPVALEFEGRRWTLGAKEIAGLVSVEQKVGLPAPVVSLRDEPLRQMVDRIAAEVDQPAANARLDWNGGSLKVIRPGQDGRQVDSDKALAALQEAISGNRRVVPLPVAVQESIGGSLDPGKLGIKELIEVGRTPLAGVPEKIYNIKLAASRLNGVVVPPGEVLSFNHELGPTTLKSGYQIGFGIAVNDGQMETVPSVAGGICQVSTTLLHAVFWAGYQIEERYPHLYWIATYGSPPRGMLGLDATVDDPNLDFKFVNNTENYLLIQTKTEGGYLEFDLYGTKPTWKVEVEGPIATNVIKADPAVVRQEEPTMAEGSELWVERATDGMDVTIIRKVTQGNDVRTLRIRSPYQPSRNVLMVGTKKTQPDPGAPTAAASAATQPQSPAAP
ncbi:MAG: VanW family protein [Chloroflexota bacterium]